MWNRFGRNVATILGTPDLVFSRDEMKLLVYAVGSNENPMNSSYKG